MDTQRWEGSDDFGKIDIRVAHSFSRLIRRSHHQRCLIELFCQETRRDAVRCSTEIKLLELVGLIGNPGFKENLDSQMNIGLIELVEYVEGR